MNRTSPESIPSIQSIRSTIVQIVAASLAADPAKISADSRLINDLGMDSLDFLDILFQLEKKFGRTIRDADFNRLLRPDKSELAQAGEFLRPEEIERIAPIMPALAEAAVVNPVRRRELFTFLTIDTLVRMVERKLNNSTGSESETGEESDI